MSHATCIIHTSNVIHRPARQKLDILLIYFRMLQVLNICPLPKSHTQSLLARSGSKRTIDSEDGTFG